MGDGFIAGHLETSSDGRRGNNRLRLHRPLSKGWMRPLPIIATRRFGCAADASSVAEMAHPREQHADAVLVRRPDGILVADGAAGLNDRGHSDFRRLVHAIA